MLAGLRSADSYAAAWRVAACLAAEPGTAAGDWLEVWEWQAQGIVPAGARVTKKTLDRIDTPRPILVRGAVFPSRRGMLPGVRATIDFLATALKAQI